GEELLERRRLSRLAGDDQLGRDARRRAVVLEHERLQHRADVAAIDVLEVEAVAVDELPVAQREDLDRGAVAVDRDPEHVDGPNRAAIGGLPFGEMADRVEAVAVAGGILESLVLRRLPHLPLELALDRPRLPGQELDHAIDDLALVR